MRAVVLLLVCLPLSARAEADLNLWLEAGVSKELDKRFEVSLDQHLRFDADVSRLQAVMPELMLSYRIHKMLRVAAGYRLQYERNNDGELELRHRGMLDVRPRIKAGPVELTLRERFQEEVRGSFSSDDLRHTIRSRLAIALLSTKPWKPAVSAETFHRLWDGDTIHLQKIRLTAGVSVEVYDHEIELAYKVEVAQYDPDDPTPHIISVGYHYKLP